MSHLWSSVVWFLLSLTGIFLLLPVLSFNTSFDMCSAQLIISILRHTFISKASNLGMSSFLIVLISAQYKVTLQITVFTILFSRHLHSSFFSILPLVILSSWKRLLCYPWESILGLRVATPRFWEGGRREGRRGVVGVVDRS